MIELIADDKPPMTLEEIDSYFEELNKVSPIYINENIFNGYESLKEFLQQSYHIRKIASEDGYLRNLSVHDTFRICKHFYPKTTFKEVIAIYKDFYKHERLDGWKCPDIKRRILKYEYDGDVQNEYSKDEFGHTLKSLLNLANN